MPETPEQLHARAAGALQMLPVVGWDTFPFDGEMRPRPLAPPVEREAPRHGEGGVDCRRCAASDDAYLWTSERWRVHALDRPSGLPVVVLLEPRAHYVEPGDLPADLAEQGSCSDVSSAPSGRSARSVACTSAAGVTAASTCTGGSWRARPGCRS